MSPSASSSARTRLRWRVRSPHSSRIEVEPSETTKRGVPGPELDRLAVCPRLRRLLGTASRRSPASISQGLPDAGVDLPLEVLALLGGQVSLHACTTPFHVSTEIRLVHAESVSCQRLVRQDTNGSIQLTRLRPVPPKSSPVA